MCRMFEMGKCPMNSLSGDRFVPLIDEPVETPAVITTTITRSKIIAAFGKNCQLVKNSQHLLV